MKFHLNESLNDLNLSEGIFDKESNLERLKELALERMNRIDRALAGINDGLSTLGDNDEDDDAATAALRKELEAKRDIAQRAKKNLGREMDELKIRIEQERQTLGDNSVYSELDDMELADKEDDTDSKTSSSEKDGTDSSEKDSPDKTDKKDKSSKDNSKSAEVDDEDDVDDEDKEKQVGGGKPKDGGGGGKSDPNDTNMDDDPEAPQRDMPPASPDDSEDREDPDDKEGSDGQENKEGQDGQDGPEDFPEDGEEPPIDGDGPLEPADTSKTDEDDVSDGSDSEDEEDNPDDTDDNDDLPTDDRDDADDDADDDDDKIDGQDGPDDSDGSDKSNSKSNNNKNTEDQGKTDKPQDQIDPEGNGMGSIIRNPFSDLKIVLPTGLGGNQIQEPTLQQLIQMLKKQHLTGDAKRGALDGLKQILADKTAASGAPANESLQEAVITDNTSILNMSSEDFSDMINDIIATAVKTKGAVKVAPKAKRIELSQELSDDPRGVWNEIKRDERINQVVDPIHGSQAEVDRIKALRQSNARNFGTFEKFKETLYDVIKDQVQNVYQTQNTHRVPNKRLASSDKELKQGQIRKLQAQENIPKLQIYVDQSGSWDDRDLKYSRSILTELAEFEEQGVLKIEPLYFSDTVQADPAAARAEGGTTAWSKILDNIINTKTNNVVIITDNDLADVANKADKRKIQVDGGVWFLYKPESRNPGAWCPDHLHGEIYNGEFFIK